MTLFDDEIAARTLWGECRGESHAGKVAVAHVIRNRLAAGRFGKTVAAVCLAPLQFSCWNATDPNRHLMLELDDLDAMLVDCHAAWAESEMTADPTQGATHYRVIGTYARWADGVKPLTAIGHHEFFAVD